MHAFTLFMTTSIALLATPADAQSETSANQAQLCLLCHRPDHPQYKEVPLLEAQPAAYLYRQLQAYRDGTRHDPTYVMRTNVATLADEVMRELSVYLSDRELPTVDHRTDPDRALAGQALAHRLGCSDCHQASFAGQEDVPRLAGQVPAYTVLQLQAFQAGERTHGTGENAASGLALDADAMQNLAHFFAGLR